MAEGSLRVISHAMHVQDAGGWTLAARSGRSWAQCTSTWPLCGRGCCCAWRLWMRSGKSCSSSQVRTALNKPCMILCGTHGVDP